MANFLLLLSAIIAIIVALNLDKVLKWTNLTPETDAPHVKIPLGGINGYYNVSYRGRKYAAFESIPYALPPIGERRFQPPHPITPWSEDIEAKTLPDACLHYNAVFDKISGKEDCLHLNIYVPVTENVENASLPVLFWIHGGGFQRGTSSNYRARYLMDKDVIVVTTNYRVGVFGFLSTGDEVVPGNMGLKDQNLALRWVNENIEYFGGDAKKITIAGVSAGGASVHYHYLSPMSRGLFRNGISFSGSALASWTHTKNTSEVTRTLASSINCPATSSIETVECLKKVPAEDIIHEVRNILQPLATSYFLFPPVTENTTENYFINKSPQEIIENGEAYDAPWIAGVVQDDGLFVTGSYILNDTAVSEVDQNWRTYAPYALNYKFTKAENEQGKLADMIRQHYFGDKHFVEKREQLTKLIGDDLIFVPTVKAAQMHAKLYESPVWFYYYTYRAAQSYSDFLTNTTEDIGVNHDDDVYLVLENRFIDPTITEKDRTMLKEMLNFWYSFIDEGKPNLGVKWETLNSDDKNFKFMHIAGPKRYKMESNNNFGDIKFWNDIGL